MSIDIEFDAWQRNHFASIMAHMRAAGNNDPVLSGMIQSAIKGAWQAARAAIPQAQTCRHRVADARNPVVTSGYICIDCGAVFAAADHDIPPAPTPAAAEVHQWRRRDVDMWHDTTKEDAYSRVDEIYEARTLYTSLVAAPLPRQAAVQGEFSAHPDRIIQQANEVRDAVRYQLVRAIYGASARFIPGPIGMAETPEQFDAAVDQIREYRDAAKSAPATTEKEKS